jgi:hypothetical protein
MSQLLLDSQSLLDRFDISADDLSLLKKCGETLGAATIDRVVDRFYEWLPQQPVAWLNGRTLAGNVVGIGNVRCV